MPRKIRILLSPGYHAEAGETKGHLHDVYTTIPPLAGNQRLHVGTLTKAAVDAWANAADQAKPAPPWHCAARKQGTAGGNAPADCDWPVCGCDPQADKVIAALQESGVIA